MPATRTWLIMIAAGLAVGASASAHPTRQEAGPLVRSFLQQHRGQTVAPNPPPTPNPPQPPPPQPPPPQPPPAPTASDLGATYRGAPLPIFRIGNDNGVGSGPTRPSIFVLGQPTLITRLTDYHWNGGRGAPAGQIALRDHDGRTYGPWRATLINGVYWQVEPGVLLPPGQYEVLDSDPATWAQNEGTGGAGHTWAEGVPQGAATPPPHHHEGPPRQIFKIGNDGAVGNGATAPSLFVLDRPTRILRLTDYHWNGGRGAPAGQIAIQAEDGRRYGPWQATLINGVYWQVEPNAVLPAGRYQVLDSDPATWSQNGGTGGAGMTWADGAPQ